jgi:anti-sigma regulatory factor (Ser/Thr protein kinase)
MVDPSFNVAFPRGRVAGQCEDKRLASARETFLGDSLIQVMTDRPGWVRLRVSPTLESKEKVAEYFRTQLEGLPDTVSEGLVLAIHELVSNAIEHGCRLDPALCVDIAMVRTERLIIVHVRDDGAGFSLGSIQHAAVSNPPDQPLQHTELRSQMGLRPGGFGIMLVKQVADELIYDEDGNEVLLLKYLDPVDGKK